MNKFDVVQSWIDNVAYSHSKCQSTAYAYKRNLDLFSEFIGKSVAEMTEDYNKLDDREFRRVYAQYIKAFISELSRRGNVSNTINAMVAAVKSFFKYSDWPLGFVPVGNCRVVYHNRDITTKEVQAILAASKPRDKAFFAMMAQGGFRPDTLVKLKLKDLEPEFSNFKPEKLSIAIIVSESNTKGMYGAYWSFMGEESVNYLKAYFNSERPNIQPDDLIFSLHGSESNASRKDKAASTKSFSKIFANTLKQLQKNNVLSYEQGKPGKPSQLRMYTLRKYFRRYAGPAGTDNVNLWMGHIGKLGSDAHYMSRDIEYYRKIYNESALPHLRLESSTAVQFDKDVREKTKEIDVLAKQVAELQKTVEHQSTFIDKYMSNHSATVEQKIKVNTLGNSIANLIQQQLDSSCMIFEDFMKSLSNKSEKRSQ
jgi:integrase